MVLVIHIQSGLLTALAQNLIKFLCDVLIPLKMMRLL